MAVAPAELANGHSMNMDESNGLVSTAAVRRHIDKVLAAAAEIKPDGALEPSLTSTQLSGAIAGMKAELGGLHKETVELALREKFYELLMDLSEDAHDFGRMWNLLDVSQALSDADLCELGLPFWLVEELLDSQTIEGCRFVFDYLDSRREHMITNFDSKHLIVLRFCNELLRRLSRAEDTVFCGRVFIFLFQCFPLSDRSSVNLRGEYHTENRTIFEEKPTNSGSDGMDIDIQVDDATVTTDQEPKDPEAADPTALYPIFWSLQNYFSDPTKLFKTENLTAFKSSLDATVKRFQQIQSSGDDRNVLKASEEARKGLKRKRGEEEDAYNPKYLTSPDLFELELNELTFRRHILVQALILLDFLLSLTPSAKEKLSDITSQNRSVVYAFVLSPVDTEWALREKSRLTMHLQQSPDGKFYHRMVDTILTRDKNWVRWKLAGCPSFELEALSPSDFKLAQRKAEDLCRERRLRADVMGAVSLNFLSSGAGIGDNGLSKLRNPDRVKLPTLDELYRKAEMVELDREILPEDDEEALDKSREAIVSLKWRAFRVAAKKRLPRFDALNELQDLKPFLEQSATS